MDLPSESCAAEVMRVATRIPNEIGSAKAVGSLAKKIAWIPKVKALTAAHP